MGGKIESILEEFEQGKMVILVDDRRNGGEGHVIIAAEKVTPEAINFLAKYARGIVCLAMTGERLDDLDLQLMVQNNGSNCGKAFTVSIEAKHNVTTGISAFDRATTILTAIDPSTGPEDLVRPGHIFPLRAVKHGVLSQASEIEAAVDLARLAGLYPAGVVCTLLNEDGMTPKLTEILEFAKLHRLKIASIGDLIRYRIKTERLVQQIAKIKLPLKWGERKNRII